MPRRVILALDEQIRGPTETWGLRLGLPKPRSLHTSGTERVPQKIEMPGQVVAGAKEVPSG